MPWFFAATLLVSSALLFLIQPLFAKMVLPLLGGTPAVWNTCMVFFQAALLAGYGYSHALPAWMGVRKHSWLHLIVLGLPALSLPLALRPGWEPPAGSNPVFWLLGLLAVSVGLPFFVVSTSGPLLQKWFARTGHSSAHDPYFLYAASNLGSVIALLAYPLLLEPNWSLRTQARLWTFGYLVLAGLIVACADIYWRREKPIPSGDPVAEPSSMRKPLSAALRLRWVVLAFVPSSLLLSVTTYLTTDIAAIPLLWIVPLTLYLLSFVIVFARRPVLPHALVVRSLPLAILVLVLVMLSEATEPVWLLLTVHLLAFFVTSLMCHGELARLRPSVDHLTEYYLWLSVGGVLGGIFNALVAPVLFSSVTEYPLVLVLACLLRPGHPQGTPSAKLTNIHEGKTIGSRADWLWSIALAGLTAALVLLVQACGVSPGQASVGLMFGLPAIVCYTFLARPVRFGLGIGGLLLASTLYPGVHGNTLLRERSFFGIHRVTLDPTGRQHQLIHGNTVHGRQSTDPGRRGEPLAYYHRTGPIGQVFSSLAREPQPPRVGVVGLGAGSLAAYSRPQQTFTYYEIDPTVIRIAKDRRFFTFLADAPTPIAIVVGDARLTLQQAPDASYDLLVLDAFSSDAIPLHLLTREALLLYTAKLDPNGILAFHVSNRYLDLVPVLAGLAEDAHLRCWGQDDLELTDAEKAEGKSPSQWILMAPAASDRIRRLEHSRWQELRPPRDQAVWTDDFSNLWSVFRWK